MGMRRWSPWYGFSLSAACWIDCHPLGASLSVSHWLSGKTYPLFLIHNSIPLSVSAHGRGVIGANPLAIDIPCYGVCKSSVSFLTALSKNKSDAILVTLAMCDSNFSPHTQKPTGQETASRFNLCINNSLINVVKPFSPFSYVIFVYYWFTFYIPFHSYVWCELSGKGLFCMFLTHFYQCHLLHLCLLFSFFVVVVVVYFFVFCFLSKTR